MMDGKVVLVTGATNGVGKAAAKALVEAGATVGVIGRNPALGAKVVEELQGLATKPNRVQFLRADFSDLDQVRTLGVEIVQHYPRIDVLINNAGTINLTRQLSKQGFEETFAVNHLAHFLLTGLVLPRLGAGSRIINVSSNAHEWFGLDFGDLQTSRWYFAFKAYGRSKLANIYFTTELARRFADRGITANAMHPGPVASHFAFNNGPLAALAMTVSKPFFISPERAARTAFYLATSPEVANVTGKYFYKSREHRPHRRALDADAARRLWDASQAMTGSPFA